MVVDIFSSRGWRREGGGGEGVGVSKTGVKGTNFQLTTTLETKHKIALYVIYF